MHDINDLLVIKNIYKSFPGVKALKDVSFTIKKGEVHGLLGENGAGKSTLIKCIMKAYQPESGEILLRDGDNWINSKSPLESKKNGMYANYQHVNIAKELSVAENYFLGRMPKTRLGIIDWKVVYRESKEILKRFNLNIDPRTLINDLSVAMQEMVMISKISTVENLKLVIFDEPTALLENDKVDILFRYIRKLKKMGVSVIYISHRLEELDEICDRVTVLKDGEYVSTDNMSDVNKDILINKMVGRKLENIYDINHQKTGEEVLRVENISLENKFKNISFNLYRGEILGFFGLVGAGRTDIMRSLYGAEKIDSGKIFISGIKAYIRNPVSAMKQGIGLIPENRREEGLALELDVKENININSLSMISKFGVISLKKEKQRAQEYVKKLNIRTPSINQLVKNLSGGNQQKAVISKLLCRHPEVFIFDEPTVGVDVGAKQEIYKLIENLTANGKAVIIVSSYLPEVIGLSDRIMVISEGELVGEISRADVTDTTEEDIIRIAAQ